MTADWNIRRGTASDAAQWAPLRQALWPDEAAEQLADEIEEMLSGGTVGFLAFDKQHVAIAFAEATLRHDYVNGTESSPVGFLEGWYVAPQWRGKGVGRALVMTVEEWARDQGCREFASDALLDNTASLAAHVACGFEETERVVYFRKWLDT
ncbi:aminoglycoside 6'-N-acetyltransferase [Pseudoxanthomonas sp. UTMC 1351]|uniref:aminoglycoside 6'-N-acetyltransferase n=1 Tax=Pseudoxanthomonas sp. UTMC 1351 TaxID=2695853 RepID=UPI0034CD8715